MVLKEEDTQSALCVHRRDFHPPGVVHYYWPGGSTNNACAVLQPQGRHLPRAKFLHLQAKSDDIILHTHEIFPPTARQVHDSLEFEHDVLHKKTRS